MEDKIAVDHQNMLNRKHQEEEFSLWDEFDLIFEEIYPPDTLEALINLLNRMGENKQVDILRRLGKIGGKLPDGPKRGVIVYLLSKYIEDTQVEVRITAIQAIGSFFSEVLASKLLSDKNTHVRIASADALGELEVSVTLQALKGSLNDKSWEVRATAIQTLGNLGERLIVKPLKEALDDEDFSVRSAALHMLGIFKDSLSTMYLVSLAQEKTQDWITRDAAVTVLERIGEYTFAQPLREKLTLELEAEITFAEEEVLDSEDALLENIKDQINIIEHKEDTRPRQQDACPPFSSKIKKVYDKIRMQLWDRLGHKNDEDELRTSLSGFNKGVSKKKASLNWSKWGKKVAYSSHYPNWKNFFFHAKGVIFIVFCLCCFIMGGFSMLRSYASDTRTISTWEAPQQQNDAHLVVISQPKVVIPYQRFSVRVNAFNTGLATWADIGNYQLICNTLSYQNLNCLGMDTLGISHPVPSIQGTYTFVLPFTTPNTVGTYISCWTMAHNNVPFGNKICIKIHIS